MLCRDDTWPVKERNAIRLEKDDVKMLRWMCNVRLEDKITAEELRTTLKMWNLLKVSGSFPRRPPRKTWSELIRGDLKKKVNSAKA